MSKAIESLETSPFRQGGDAKTCQGRRCVAEPMDCRGGSGEGWGMETAAEFFTTRAGRATGAGLMRFFKKVPNLPPEPGDEAP